MSSALAYLNLEGLVHNDIKPANVTYSPQRGAVLIDFGLATKKDEPISTGGTPWYIPPEFAEKIKSQVALRDIWALGVTMLYVLRKIELPDRVGRGWLIRDVLDETTVASQKMKAWLAKVGNDRERLDRGDLVERLVFRMLDSHDKRVQAAENVAAFEEAERG